MEAQDIITRLRGMEDDMSLSDYFYVRMQGGQPHESHMEALKADLRVDAGFAAGDVDSVLGYIEEEISAGRADELIEAIGMRNIGLGLP